MRVEPLHSFGSGRFEVFADGAQHWRLRDWLRRNETRLPATPYRELRGRALLAAVLRDGFVPAAIGFSDTPIADRPEPGRPGLFWQFPACTERDAMHRHESVVRVVDAERTLHTYVGLPWATWIDMDVKQSWPRGARDRIERALWRLGVQLAGLASAARESGGRLRLHTVCQHIEWRRMLPVWAGLGISDVWLSHCPSPNVAEARALAVHPWPLFAVNIEDPERRQGLEPDLDPSQRPILASFIGAHMAHYLSDIRRRLEALEQEPGFVISVNDEWHFERIVYREQIGAGPAPAPSGQGGDIATYNRTLCRSRFALCPAGAGANTIRLWEALAVGSIPVLFGHAPSLPPRGPDGPIDWDAIVIRVADHELSDLPKRLRAVPVDELRQRHRLAKWAYQSLRRLTCF